MNLEEIMGLHVCEVFGAETLQKITFVIGLLHKREGSKLTGKEEISL